MLMPKKNRQSIYEYLFKEGVIVARKDFHAPKHGDITGVPNLQVIKAMQSLTSRGYVKEQFAWRHFYWYLTNEGIEYLRDFLHLPPEIVPATLKRQQRAVEVRTAVGARGPGGAGDKGDDDREHYRRGGFDKTGEAGAGAAQMEFRGGFGRGRPPQQ